MNMGVDPVWLAMLITVNLQSSFLTPPFGWALFYLKGVLQLLALGLVFMFPSIALWLPKAIGW